MSKPKLAIAWNSSCGGCDEAIVDIEEQLLDVAAKVDFALWPCAMDFKYSDVEMLPDKEITVALINGGIQNSHQKHVVELIRKKAQIVIAFGSCACLGGVPALANLTSTQEIMRNSYIDSPTVVNPEGKIPKAQSSYMGHSLTLPELFPSLLKLDDVIEVDYFLPGCPPTKKLILEAITLVLENRLPARGSVLLPMGSLCSSCERNESKPIDIAISSFRRIHEIEADPNLCFLAQGILCMGPATRDGCEAACIQGHMPCTGCFGPTKGADQGAQMIAALGGLISGSTKEDGQLAAASLPDPAGSFYRYSMAASLLGRKRDETRGTIDGKNHSH